MAKKCSRGHPTRRPSVRDRIEPLYNQASISNFRTKLLTELECITCDSRRRNKANNTQVSFINLSVTLIVLVFSSISAQFNMNLIKSSRLSRPRRLSLKVKRKIFSRTSF